MSLEKAIPKCIKEAVFTGLSKATSRGNTECITLLLDELNKLNAPLNEKQRLELLQEAICHNQLYALLLLIKSDPAVSKKIMPLITLSATAVQNTDLIIIKELREQGVSFTPSAEELILAKTQNIYLSFITLLTLVLDHIQLFLGKKTAISYNKSSLLEMKKNAVLELINTLGNQIEDPDSIQELKNDLHNATNFMEILEIKESLMRALPTSAPLIAPEECTANNPKNEIQDIKPDHGSEITEVEINLENQPQIEEPVRFTRKGCSITLFKDSANKLDQPVPTLEKSSQLLTI